MTATLSLTCDGYFSLTRLAHRHGSGVFVVPVYRLCRYQPSGVREVDRLFTNVPCPNTQPLTAIG